MKDDPNRGHNGAHTCNPSTWVPRKEDAESEVSLTYILSRKETKKDTNIDLFKIIH